MHVFAVVVVVFCIGTHVSADVKLQGAESKRIVLDKDTFVFKMNYTKAYAFYNTTDKKQLQYYTLNVGGCKLEFMAKRGGFSEVNNRYHLVKNASGVWNYFHVNSSFGKVNSSSISFHGIKDPSGIRNNNQNYSCKAQFDITLVPGKYVVNVSLSGDASPDLVVKFDGELLTKSMISKTTSSTPALKKFMLEFRHIILIVALALILFQANVFCIIMLCWYYRMEKAKEDQKLIESEYSMVERTTSTTSTAPQHLIDETDLYESE